MSNQQRAIQENHPNERLAQFSVFFVICELLHLTYRNVGTELMTTLERSLCLMFLPDILVINIVT